MNPPEITKALIQKYDLPGPRYTSYPTAPEWTAEVSHEAYAEKLKIFGETDKPVSLYVHIPFCQTLCWYCGCHTLIRKNSPHYGDEYLELLFKEVKIMCQKIGRKPKVRQLHFGGGTPTFLTSEQLTNLFRTLENYFEREPDCEVAIEVDPRTVSLEKVRVLRSLGFNRISMGVQDFDPKVQDVINRRQSFEQIQTLYESCREQGFSSINFDLIYGLPAQTKETFSDTLKKTLFLKPDRIALYSYAHVPWMKPQQKRMDSEPRPEGDEKLDIFLHSRNTFLKQGYEAIAMDHFALEQDGLALAFRKGTLHRNFMGYTLKPTEDFIALGVSSIAYLERSFFQNHKDLKQMALSLERNELPVERGKILSDDDLKRSWVISSLMCRFQIDKKEFSETFTQEFDLCFEQEQGHLKRCEEDGLLKLEKDKVTVQELGKFFVRNICMGFDAYLKKNTQKTFSRTI